jgi:hypothetical protein
VGERRDASVTATECNSLPRLVLDPQGQHGNDWLTGAFDVWTLTDPMWGGFYRCDVSTSQSVDVPASFFSY